MNSKSEKRERRIGYFFILPAVIYMLIFPGTVTALVFKIMF